MDKFVTRTTKVGESAPTEKQKTDGPNQSKCQPKRRYDEAYLAFGFTVAEVGDEERPMCVLCLRQLAADSMRPNKLRRHLETSHPAHADKPINFFQRKLAEYRQQEKRMVKAASVNSKAQMASYRVAYRVAQCKKPHTIAEQLILPAAVDMVSVMLDEISAAKLKTIPLSNDTIARRICDISNDLEAQLIDKLKENRFAIQVDEATDSSKNCLFISYVRFVNSESLTMSEDLLFCKSVQTRATAEELFKIMDSYFTEHELKWENCVGFCSDGAQTMAGKRKGLQALVKRAAPDAQWTHCIIHREALASRQLSPELNEVLTAVVDVVNFIKTRPLKARLFSALCEEMGADHTAVLFHSEARWLSRGKVLSRVFELRTEIRVFLEEERMYEAAGKFGDQPFLMKLAYLSDVFAKLNELNLQLQGRDKHLPHLADKITAFIRKLEVWGRRLDQGNTDVFENLTEVAETVDSGATTVIPCIQQHISALRGLFQKYFPNSAAQYDWIVDPFNAAAPAEFSSATEEQLIELTSDSTLRLRFTSEPLSHFWLEVEREYPLVGQRAVDILLPFATSYLCEIGFSAVTSLKTKYRSQLNVAHDLRVAVSSMQPRFEKMCSAKQAHCSH
ncbi:zinc finger BED domain-containing protein 5-like [Astyanax mexicanus]|uniref:zinc finger BED domain-containing protein 5-like n=1 Tax=Astyanax mexicanus TaxID=7994 RepID=UPI0020CB4BF0|nr:zinc finger BED domain-containing protein 5-like [Astyanax mexicanus]XP_049332213.1 zinc finger BED domain-containing protein 5-like [Astyanax mexicanus]